MSFLPLQVIGMNMMLQLVSELYNKEMIHGTAYLVKYNKKYQKYEVFGVNEI